MKTCHFFVYLIKHFWKTTFTRVLYYLKTNEIKIFGEPVYNMQLHTIIRSFLLWTDCTPPPNEHEILFICLITIDYSGESHFWTIPASVGPQSLKPMLHLLPISCWTNGSICTSKKENRLRERVERWRERGRETLENLTWIIECWQYIVWRPMVPKRYSFAYNVDAVLGCLPYFPTHGPSIVHHNDHRQTRGQAVVAGVLVVHSKDLSNFFNSQYGDQPCSCKQ